MYTLNYFSPFNYVRERTSSQNQSYSTTEYACSRDISFLNLFDIMPYTYTINSNGEIYVVGGGKRVLPFTDRNGYSHVRLKTVNYTIHIYPLYRLVALLFCDPPLNTSGYSVNHINGDKSDNRACNLEWVTRCANTQHMVYENRGIAPSRPQATEKIVRQICKLFEEGNTNTEVMEILGYEKNNANHTFLRDIRSGATWKSISRDYTFSKSSKKHAYTNEEKEEISKMLLDGMSLSDIFYKMQGVKYNPDTDRRLSTYRSIQTIQAKLRRLGHDV